MLDLTFIAVIVAFFAVCVAYVRGCARIVGRDTSVVDATSPQLAGEDECVPA